MKTKKCSKCDNVKEITEFHKHKKDTEYYKSYCKNCQSKIKKENRAKIRSEIKENLKCSKCGYNQCLEALEFHHSDPNKKEYSICFLVNSEKNIKAIQEEIDKCIVLCANCHREEHWRLKQLNELE